MHIYNRIKEKTRRRLQIPINLRTYRKERQYCTAPPKRGFLIAMYRLYGPFPFGVHTQKMVISIRVMSISSPLPKTNCETIITICTRTSSIKLPNVDWFVSAHCTVRKFRYLVSYVCTITVYLKVTLTCLSTFIEQP